MIQPHFSGIQNILIDNIGKASSSIKIAVAWFTNQKLYDMLLKKLGEGVEVSLIIRDDHINNSTESLEWSKFINSGGWLHFSNADKKMHHKYCIIDDATVVSGSYNWTYQAEFVNQENVIIAYEQEVAAAYNSNFLNVKIHSTPVNDTKLLNTRLVVEAPVEEKQFIKDEHKIAEQTINTDNILKEALLQYLSKEYGKAVTLILFNWNDFDKEPAAYETLAWSLAKQGKYEESIRYAEKGKEFENRNPEFHNVIGFAYEHQNSYVKAIENYDMAINLTPEVTTYYWNKIVALYKSGSDSVADKVKLKLLAVATNILKDKSHYTPYEIMKTYLDRGNVRSDKINKVNDGRKAKAIFDNLPDYEKDYHDLDDISSLLKS